MKIDDKVGLYIKATLVFSLMVVVLFVIAVVVTYIPGDYKIVVGIICISFVVVIMSGSSLIDRLTRDHRSQFRELKPLSWYDSIQDRAKVFLSIAVPDEMSDQNDIFANQCIRSYAENGEISLTEDDRARLSLVVLETGISSQEPGEKSYYERERVAILENILSEQDLVLK